MITLEGDCSDVFLTRSQSQNCYFIGLVRWQQWDPSDDDNDNDCAHNEKERDDKNEDCDQRVVNWLLNLAWCFPSGVEIKSAVATIINIQHNTIHQYTTLTHPLTHSLTHWGLVPGSSFIRFLHTVWLNNPFPIKNSLVIEHLSDSQHIYVYIIYMVLFWVTSQVWQKGWNLCKICCRNILKKK